MGEVHLYTNYSRSVISCSERGREGSVGIQNLRAWKLGSKVMILSTGETGRGEEEEEEIQGGSVRARV